MTSDRIRNLGSWAGPSVLVMERTNDAFWGVLDSEEREGYKDAANDKDSELTQLQWARITGFGLGARADAGPPTRYWMTDHFRDFVLAQP